MNTLLTNFSLTELAFLIQLVDARWKEATSAIVDMEDFFNEIDLLKENERYQEYVNEQALASLWLTQLQTALEIVKHREAINAN